MMRGNYASSSALGLSLGEPYNEGIVDEEVRPGLWRVKFQGSFWSAKAAKPRVAIVPNDVVTIVGRQSLTLLIQPKGNLDSLRSSE